MRLDINLASQPYEDARQFWMRWGSALGLAAFFTLILLTLTVTGWFNARRDRSTISSLHKRISDRDVMRQEAEEFLNRQENRATRDDSQFLNELIERKSFSWTRVLEDLEKVMPARVHLVSISPELDEENQLALKMTVAGDSRDKAIELARRMEDSHRFTQTYIESEHRDQASASVQFNIVATYVPQLLPASTAPATTPPATPASKTQTSKRSGF
jgi:type IV pilus assembly protein PilN